jgi:hypothetical protein
MAYSPHPKPNPTNAPGAPVGRNQLALVGFVLSLVFPIGVILNLFGLGIYHAADEAALLTYRLGLVLEMVGVPALIAAIVMGHIALGRANRYSPQLAWRGLAIAELVLGYLSLMVFLWVIWILIHGIKLHFVF